MYDPDKSLKSAQKLLGAPDIENIVSFRIETESLGCCCSDCWPLVWQEVNNLIHPQGPIKHEGHGLIEIDNERYVLKQHESGPEIMLLMCASLNLITAVINLFVAIFGSLREKRKCPSKVRIIQRQFIHNEVTQEMLVEIKLDGSKMATNKMEGIIETAIKNSLVSKKK